MARLLGSRLFVPWLSLFDGHPPKSRYSRSFLFLTGPLYVELSLMRLKCVQFIHVHDANVKNSYVRAPSITPNTSPLYCRIHRQLPKKSEGRSRFTLRRRLLTGKRWYADSCPAGCWFTNGFDQAAAMLL